MNPIEHELMWLQSRLRVLEQRSVRQKRLLVGVLGVALGGALFGVGRGGPQVDDVVTARQVRVVDQEGKVVVLLGVDPDEGGGRLVVNGKGGGRIAQIESNGDGHGKLTTYSSSGELLVFIAALTGGEGHVGTWDGDGHELVRLGADMRGLPTVTTFNKDGGELLLLYATTHLEGAARFRNAAGETLSQIGASEGGDGFISTSDADGNSLIRITSNEAGQGHLEVNGADQKPLVAMTGTRPGNGTVHVLETTGGVSHYRVYPDHAGNEQKHPADNGAELLEWSELFARHVSIGTGTRQGGIQSMTIRTDIKDRAVRARLAIRIRDALRADWKDSSVWPYKETGARLHPSLREKDVWALVFAELTNVRLGLPSHDLEARDQAIAALVASP